MQSMGDVRDNIVRVLDGGKRFCGTGFFAQKEYCVTCHHCIHLDEIGQLFIMHGR